MRTYGHDVRHLRTLSAVIEDSIAIFAQDVSEYAFVGLMGGATACIAALCYGAACNDPTSGLNGLRGGDNRFSTNHAVAATDAVVGQPRALTVAYGMPPVAVWYRAV